MKRIMCNDELTASVESQREEEEFYRINAVNYKGKTDGGIRYSEVIANMLNDLEEEKLEEFLKNNSHMGPEKAYPAEPIHKADEISYAEGSNRNEENIAKRMMQLGTIREMSGADVNVVDYQVPVNRAGHSHEGKVDLVLDTGSQILLTELKDEDSNETLLRAMVEAKTYYTKITDPRIDNDAYKRFVRCYGSKEMRPAVMIFEGEDSQPWTDFDEMQNGDMPTLRELLIKWHIVIYKVVPKESYTEKTPYKERQYKLQKIWSE